MEVESRKNIIKITGATIRASGDFREGLKMLKFHKDVNSIFPRLHTFFMPWSFLLITRHSPLVG
jgi:hypothetical protein